MRIGRLAVVAALGLLAAGCVVPRTAAKVARALSPVRLVRPRRGLAPVVEYDAAKRLFLRGEFQQAIVAFDSWLIRNPANALEPAARYYLGNALVQARRPKQATTTYQRLVELFPETDWAAFARDDLAALARGESYVPIGRRLHWWNPADWFEPDPPAVRQFKEARALFDRHKYEQALTTFRTLAERHPDNPMAPAAWHYVGRCYERLGDIDKARESFARIVEQHQGTHWEKLAGDDLERLREE